MRSWKRILLPILSFIALSTLIFFMPIPGNSGTIAPGQTRTVEGPVSAVDVEGRGLVLAVPTPKGKWTVGVTVTDSTKFRNGMSLRDLKVGDTIRLEYTREGNRLIGVSVSKEPVPAKTKPKENKKELPKKAESPAKPAAKESPAK